MSDDYHTKSTEIWKGKDPENRVVRLYEPERDHIISEHDIMGQNFTAIYDTIEMPQSIYKSGESDDREVYFKKSKQASYGSRFYTKAVVQFNKEGTEGYIVTAFPHSKEGGNIGERTYPKN